LDATSILSGYGLAGLVILALAGAVITLFWQNQKLHQEWRQWLQKSNEALEQSNKENRETTDKLANLSDRLLELVPKRVSR